MKVSSCRTFLIAAAALAAQVTAGYTITAGKTMSAEGVKHVQFVKQWTLNAGDDIKAIDALDLSLAGNAYVSYVSDLPKGVIGYVNVSGSSKDVVNGVVVGKDIDEEEERSFGEIGNAIDNIVNLDVLDNNDNSDSDNDDNSDSDNDDNSDSDNDDNSDSDNDDNSDSNNGDKDDNDDSDGELEVHLRSSVTKGYLLVEIFLAVPDAVSEVMSRLSAHVVIEDNVLLRKGKKSVQSIEAGGISAVYVSTPDTKVHVNKLNLETNDEASINYISDIVSVGESFGIEAGGSSSIQLSVPSVTTARLNMNAENNSSQICIQAEDVKVEESDIVGKGQIHLPTSSKKHKHKHKNILACQILHPPAREAAKIVAGAALLDDNETSKDDIDEHDSERMADLDDRKDLKEDPDDSERTLDLDDRDDRMDSLDDRDDRMDDLDDSERMYDPDDSESLFDLDDKFDQRDDIDDRRDDREDKDDIEDDIKQTLHRMSYLIGKEDR